MSLLLAVRDDHDVVMASDGRVLNGRSDVWSEDSLKTVALNETVCLGLAGETNSMRPVLSALGLRTRGSHPTDVLRACQESTCPVDVDYSDARDEVTHVLRWIGRRASKGALRLPAVLLAGSSAADRPALCEWRPPDRAMESAGSSGYAQAIVGCHPEEGTTTWVTFLRWVDGDRSTEQAEERLTRAVRVCAGYFGAAGPVNGTVFVRRLSRGFALSQAEGYG